MKSDYLKLMRSGAKLNITPNIWDVKYKHQHNTLTGYRLEPRNFTCEIPTFTVHVDRHGNIFLCTCHGHLPYSLGSILDFNSFEEIWASPMAKKLQENTKCGSTFKFCHLELCYGPKTFNDDYFGRYQFIVGIDESCNLQCPSCRTKMIHHKAGAIFERKRKCMDKFLELLDKFKKPCDIQIGGDGEVFASKIYSKVMYDYVPNSKHRFSIRTNGTLIDQNKLLKSKVIDQLSYFTISIDAGSEEIYNIVRPPGSWKKLINNLDFLSENNYIFDTNFVIQKNNLYDVINWVNLCQHYNVRGNISEMENWGTWGIGKDDQFKNHAVFDKKHELYNDYLKVIEDLKNHEYFKEGKISITF